jgi:hypothetical protein
MAVIYPSKNCLWKKTNTTFIIYFVWILSLLTASPLLYYSRAVPFNYSGLALYDCKEEWEGELKSSIYTVMLFVITFILPLISLTFLYGSIGIQTFKKIKPGVTLFSIERVRYRRNIKVFDQTFINLINL